MSGAQLTKDDLCSLEYRFDTAAIDALFSDALQTTSPTLH